jgi:hypothetical protein
VCMPTKRGMRKVTAGKAGVSPRPFFYHALLYKALRQQCSKRVF